MIMLEIKYQYLNVNILFLTSSLGTIRPKYGTSFAMPEKQIQYPSEQQEENKR